MRLDTQAGRVTVDGKPVKLTSHEYRVLEYLMHHRDRVVSRTELIEHLYDQDFDRDSNTIEVFVGRLRKKVGADLIETVRGLGYRHRRAGQEVGDAAHAHAARSRPRSSSWRRSGASSVLGGAAAAGAGVLFTRPRRPTSTAARRLMRQTVLAANPPRRGRPVLGLRHCPTNTRFELPLFGLVLAGLEPTNGARRSLRSRSL